MRWSDADGPDRKCRTSTNTPMRGKECYGLSAAELGQQIPPDPHSTSLTMREVEAVADFILATYKDK